MPGIRDPQKRSDGDQGSQAGCLRRAGARLSRSITLNPVCPACAGYLAAQGQVRSRRTQVRRTFAYQCVPNHVNPFDPIGSGEIFDEVDDSLLETGNRSHKDRS